MKRVASTSRLAYMELRDVLQPREQDVLTALRSGSAAPTAYKLLELMRVDHPHFDVNSIRPRLTSLRDKGLIVGGQKRRCRITGRLAWTWIPTCAHVPSPPVKAAAAQRRQAVLDLKWSIR